MAEIENLKKELAMQQDQVLRLPAQPGLDAVLGWQAREARASLETSRQDRDEARARVKEEEKEKDELRRKLNDVEAEASRLRPLPGACSLFTCAVTFRVYYSGPRKLSETGR